jgi:hypothetical protein
VSSLMSVEDSIEVTGGNAGAWSRASWSDTDPPGAAEARAHPRWVERASCGGRCQLCAARVADGRQSLGGGALRTGQEDCDGMPKHAVDNCRYCGWAVCAECIPEGSDLAVDRWVSSTGRHPLKWADRENVVQWKWCTHFVCLIFGVGGRAAPPPPPPPPFCSCWCWCCCCNVSSVRVAIFTSWVHGSRRADALTRGLSRFNPMRWSSGVPEMMQSELEDYAAKSADSDAQRPVQVPLPTPPASAHSLLAVRQPPPRAQPT